MTINTTRWSPDTCQCVIEYTWDDSVAQDQRAHNYSKHVNLCPIHATQGQTNTAFITVNDENTKKMIALQDLIDNFPAQLSSTGSAGGQLKSNLTFVYSISGTPPNRTWRFNFLGLSFTQPQLNSIQSRLDTRFGTGKVIYDNTLQNIVIPTT